MKNIILLFASLHLTNFVAGQQITAGPVVGAVSDASFRVYIQTAPNGTPAAQVFEWQVATTPSFNSVVASGIDSTRSALFGGVTVDVNGLSPDTRYYYRFLFGGQADTLQGQVKTFAPAGARGHYKIAVGSCGYGANDPLYQLIKDFEPDVFIHLGDWHWPPAQFGNDYCLYPEKRAGSFAERYNDPSMRKLLLPFFPIDYVYDDDFAWNDGEGWTYPTFTVTPLPTGGAKTDLFTNPMPPGIREGAIQGYFDHFPAYPAADTSAGIHHRFRLGNAEFFMLDTRNSRTPRHEAFQLDSTGKYTYEPPAGHTMLGASQRAWLTDALQHSDADWKFIGSSVIFNKNYRTVLDVGLSIQNLALPVGGDIWTGMVIASQMSYNWAGYPADQDTILQLAQSGAIKDVIALSGDSHANMIDDGAHAGLPELSASGLAANDEGTVNSQINLIAGFLGYPKAEDLLWNGGGNGLGDQADNARDGFGTIEIFGSDSVRLCVLDELGTVMGCKTILHSSLASKSLDLPAAHHELIITPNPSKDRITVQSAAQFASVQVTDASGVVVQVPAALGNKSAELNLSGMPSGAYIIRAFDARGRVVGIGRFVKI